MKDFEAHPLIPGGQLQTMVAFLWPSAKIVATDEHLQVAVSGGDQIELALNYPEGEVQGIIYMLHGLGGDANSTYKRRIMPKLLPHGFLVVRHNHRGNGEKVAVAKGLYHSGSVDDVLAGLRSVSERWPGLPIFVIGFSLSGTMLLNLLSWKPDDVAAISEIKAALTVCSPLDLQASADTLARLRHKHLDLFYAKSALKYLLERNFVTQAEMDSKFKKPTLRKVDDLVTALHAGFKDAAEYYQGCSPQRNLQKIRLPTLILATADDPIVPPESARNAKHSAAVTIRLERSGGHMGFISRQLSSHKDHRWMDDFILEWALGQKLSKARS